MKNILYVSIAKSTRQVYSRAWALFQECMLSINQPQISVSNLPLSMAKILIFLTYLKIQGFASSTITTYVSAIGYVHKFHSVTDPTASFVVQRCLAAVNKHFGSADARLPITQFLLSRLILATDNIITSSYQATLFKAMLSVAFYGLFRIGEITVQKSGDISLLFENIKIHQDRIVIKITTFKNNKSSQPFEIVLHNQSNVTCPYSLLIQYLELRGSHPGPLFQFHA